MPRAGWGGFTGGSFSDEGGVGKGGVGGEYIKTEGAETTEDLS